ncbi:uncharacterized protein LOC120158051 [Hibiscus syriacus]|uniref:uncharacterized protein LOC120158051 n=1 Tax=Hibiscus syriacus TaxID=106335 RepID=UPI0019209443|nr:uncharacterized protein LOC120158051 [Hibiscus syriacus]
MDTITASKSRLHYAKVCVEIGAKEEIPKSIKVELANGQTTLIYVEVPWFPSRCSKCISFGHSDKNCHAKQSTSHSTLKIWRKNTDSSANLSSSKEELQNQKQNSSISKEQSDTTDSNTEDATSSHSPILTDLSSKDDSSVPHSISARDGIIPSLVPHSNPTSDVIISLNPTLPPSDESVQEEIPPVSQSEMIKSLSLFQKEVDQ